ncbi:unnamed protein product [Rhizoctonia solani]|uniref:Fungal N-terminal domain-containing protein n=1 Tax=Rhizoctonia solani TaxID=456999 RepID=A0A8H3HAN3_9AGAM|nr:unnamed protein product [Rhizoctonia solani]
MADGQSDYEQQVFGTAANAAGVMVMLGQLTQLAKHVSSKYKPDPTKELEKVQKELDSFNVLLERERNVVTGDTFTAFEKQYIRIQYRIQKETDRINKPSRTRSERQESMESIRRISGNIQKVRKEFVTSSANARNMRCESTSTIHTQVDESTTANTAGGLAGISRKIWEICSSKAESNVLPTHIDPKVPREGQLSQPAPDIQNGAGYYLSFIQADGTERLVNSEDLKNDPSIAPELATAVMRVAEANQQGGAVAPAHSPQSGFTSGNTGGRAVPIYKINLERVSETSEGLDRETEGNASV